MRENSRSSTAVTTRICVPGGQRRAATEETAAAEPTEASTPISTRTGSAAWRASALPIRTEHATWWSTFNETLPSIARWIVERLSEPNTTKSADNSSHMR